MSKVNTQPSPKTQAASTSGAEPQESFSAVAQRLGDALADVVKRPNCPEAAYDAILQLDTTIFNHFPDVEISLRHSFPRRLVGALERRA